MIKLKKLININEDDGHPKILNKNKEITHN